ncbi:META domain-containing protein [Silvibacterium dinghuense]|nr:META domain-containing protein [Silvibacterium dinghuense]
MRIRMGFLVTAVVLAGATLLPGAWAQSKTTSHVGHTLTGTNWVLAEVHGESPENDTPQASIQLDAKTERLSGTGGCNRLLGSYETKLPATEAQPLHFKGVGSTMMACGAEAMQQEKSLLDALNATMAYRIRGTTLTLLGDASKDKTGKGRSVLARFEAADAIQAKETTAQPQ